MSDTVTIALTRPIQAHGETLATLELRAPTVREMRQCGAPRRIGIDNSIVVDYEACAKLLSAICAIPPSSVDQMHPSDFDEAAMQLLGFIGRSSAEPTSPSPATSAGS